MSIAVAKWAMNMNRQIGLELKTGRQSAGLDAAAVAKGIDYIVSVEWLEECERGEHPITVILFVRVCRAVGIDPPGTLRRVIDLVGPPPLDDPRLSDVEGEARWRAAFQAGSSSVA